MDLSTFAYGHSKKKTKYTFILIDGTMLLLAILCLSSCQTKELERRPNVILIMADDMGYECLSTYGSTSYSTPNLDELARTGMKFNTCVSQPLCTPSRVKIMTGLYNYRNYEHFGYLDVGQYTFGNLMRDHGYATCIAGKWQLNGLAYQDEIKDWNDSSKPHKLGFDEYSLWQLTQARKFGERFANPLIEQNGVLLERDKDAYGPDIFANFVMNFIERKKDSSFFVYYPMVLVHDPFTPTPDSKEWQDESTRVQNDTTYFKDMVAYTDKIVGQIKTKLGQLGIADNTILIFTGDNGTHPRVYSKTKERVVRGGKGNTIDAGTHVPLIINWPAAIKHGVVHEGLVDFSDFFATFADVVDSDAKNDGHSLLPLLKGQEYKERETSFVHYDPQWGKNVNRYRNQFVRNLNYKLYQDNTYFDLTADIMEERSLPLDSLSADQQIVRYMLEFELEKHPALQGATPSE